MFKHGKTAAVTVNGVELTRFLDAADLSLEVDTADTSTFGSDWKTALPGQAGGKLELSGKYDPNGGTAITLATSLGADDIIDTAADHNFVVGQVIEFATLTGGAGLTALTPYYIIAANFAARTFQVSATPGGSAINFTTDITAGTVRSIAGPNRTLSVLVGADAVPVIYEPAGATAGQLRRSFQAFVTSFSESSPVAGVVIFKSTLTIDGEVTFAVIT